MAASTSASSSSVVQEKRFRYDVFLSFRGEDTRKTFVDHLYQALDKKGITTYKDDEKIKKGEKISEQLITSIEESRFHIIVFSKNYASSSWCLEELVKILECKKTNEQTAFPIFYDVEPTEVRHQSGSVGVAFERFTRKRKRNLEDADLVTNSSAKQLQEEGDVKRWRNALKEAASLAGWELKNTVDGHEAKFIEKIMEYILPKLNFINSSINENLVGMESRINKIVSSLEIGLDSVRMIGIKGMGGGGKTTLARAVFDHISIQFEGKSFVEDVRERSKGFGLKNLQKQVLQDVLTDKTLEVTGVHDGKNMMAKMMPGKKVLIVLDDVDHIDQLKALAGSPNWFRPGSKVIITTRDEQVLKAHWVDFIHDVSLLSEEEAICLFSRCAFKREVPIQEYEELSRKVVHYAAGLPLTITVLGPFFCDRTVCEWEDALERLKTIPEGETLKRLELSYNGLDDDQKEIFLDVACLLRGETKEVAVRILESRGYNARIGLSVLEKKSLITVSYSYGAHHLLLHDLIVEMGHHIVRRLHPDEPSKHSRLWIKEEIENILVNQLATEAIRCIKLERAELHPIIIWEGLRNMKELRYLYVNHSSGTYEDIEYLPSSIQCLRWENFIERQPKKLVNLQMVESNILELREGRKRKVLNRLRFLELQISNLRTFDLGMTPNLEILHLFRCNDFVELYMPTECPKLKSVDLGFSKIRTFDLGMTPNLETLHLYKCNDFVELYMTTECPKLKSLNLSCSKIRTFDLGMTPNLEILHLFSCNDFVELYMPTECPKLKSVDLGYSKIRTFDLGMTPNLKTLHLYECNDFVELYMTNECPKLKSLTLSCSKIRTFDLVMTPNLEMLKLNKCYEFQQLHMLYECPKLKHVCLDGSKLRTFDLGMTPNLETLTLRGCNDFVELHIYLECPTLKYLSLNVSMVSKLNLWLTPGIRYLYLEGCNDYIELHIEEAVMYLDCLEGLVLSFKEIRRLPGSICLLRHLKYLTLESCWHLEQLPKHLNRLECLKELTVEDCTSLHEIPNNICKIKCLERLRLRSCERVEKLPEKLGRLESLKELDIYDTCIMRLPQSIFQLKGLRILGSWGQLESNGFTSISPYIRGGGSVVVS